MKRRRFLRHTGAAMVALNLVPSIVWTQSSGAASVFKLRFQAANSQIRHGALSLPQLGQTSFSNPFQWLGPINRNLFFGKGFPGTTGDEDFEIISLICKDPDTDEEETLQLQIGKDETLVLFKDEIVRNYITSGLKEIGNFSDNKMVVLLGSVDENEKLSFPLDSGSDYLIYNLEGKVQTEQFGQLHENESLGISKADRLDVHTELATRFLIIEYTTIKS